MTDKVWCEVAVRGAAAACCLFVVGVGAAGEELGLADWCKQRFRSCFLYTCDASDEVRGL